MIRVDIETIIMASGPVPSVIVLRERASDDLADSAPLRSLPIQTGTYEAASVSNGIDGNHSNGRPLAHDLMTEMASKLNAKIERVEINRVDLPVFYADVVLKSNEGSEVTLDARPSDALALAVRSNAPIYVEDDVMNRAATISLQNDENNDAELERFDEFVQTLSPDDF